ncbi:MAG: T-complex protein 1 subunit gamma [Marteilia pararefringens]
MDRLLLLLNPIGGVTITADGFAIVRDLFPDHPVTNLVVNGARAQDEEVGDGTTSSVIITSSILEQLIPIISQPGMHPAYLSKSLLFAKKYLLKTLDEVSEKIDLEDPEKALKKLVDSTIETKQTGKLKDLICKLSIDAIKLLTGDDFKNVNHIDIKKDLRILQIVGESEMDTSLVKGYFLPSY